MENENEASTSFHLHYRTIETSAHIFPFPDTLAPTAEISKQNFLNYNSLQSLEGKLTPMKMDSMTEVTMASDMDSITFIPVLQNKRF